MKSSLGTAAGIALLLLFNTINTLAQAQGGFTPEVRGKVYSIVVQPDNKILVAASPYVNGGPNRLQRFNADGTRDPTFSRSHGGEYCCDFFEGRSIALLPDGKILFGATGAANPSNPLSIPRLLQKLNSDGAQLNSDGTPDTSFPAPAITGVNTGQGTPAVNSIVVTPDGRIYIGGSFSTVGGVQRKNFARLNANGSLDTTFPDDVLSFGVVKSMILLPDGKLVMTGTSKFIIGGVVRWGLARLNADGSLDTSFSSVLTIDVSGTSPNIAAVVRQADGKLVISGRFTVTNGQRTFRNLARLNADGTLDPSFLMAAEDQQPVVAGEGAIMIQPDGKIVAAGCYERHEPFGPNDIYERNLCRYNADGSPDNTVLREFPPSAGGTISLGLQPDGKILLGGLIQVFVQGNRSLLHLARVRTDGTWDLPFARYDFDGDRRTDLALYRPSNQTWYIHTGQALFSHRFGASTDLPAPADYDSDGKTDYAVFRQSNGTWYWINSSTVTFSYLHWGEPGDVPVPGNRVLGHRTAFDIFRPSNSGWYRRAHQPDGSWLFATYVFGYPGDIPLAGHMGKDFQSSPAVFRPANNTFYHLREFSEGQILSKQWGQAGDLPISADFDGDLLSDVAVYTRSTGKWSIQLTGDLSTRTYFWGEPGDIPVPADYDGDQRDDIAVWRPSTGTWYIIGSTEGWRIQQFGEPGDIPIPSSYLYGLP